MDWARLAEERILESMEAGVFEHLPGKGAPINLDEYFAQPEGVRAGNAVLKNAGVVPPEVEMLKAIHELETRIAEEADPGALRTLRGELAELRTSFDIRMERRRAARRSGMDV